MSELKSYRVWDAPTRWFHLTADRGRGMVQN
jgi:hypothetical protein